ncbi:cation-translocating P-type ATPase [Gordonibacter massiliensis (ex Traore et al. 2017)]|uniref:Cation-translocating P-type ATPase n=1 Tax=Gordonibacter massiliensis (ex Traore et al. 2017) TaxID=1841863 RepID=A0A842JCK9_9ACTN|nr:cation-translocating P-type ATPase [Gordonibacter massiliensis (ex Traore et al. 2017)]MBC2889663.1 cation-translocating P-type ATPase [Gordonibacter massiliensis (ex Traore et al. 2017)]
MSSRTDSPHAEALRSEAVPWHAKPVDVALAALESAPDGISAAEARRRLAQNGPNELASKPPKSLGAMARKQLGDPMVLILVVAAVLSALLQEWAEAGIIFAIVVVNAVIGIVQESRAQSSLEALRSMSAPTARVVRDGAEEVVAARDLVVGDVVLLDDGSMVPADLRLLDTASLRTQEASLTGESVPSEKDADALVAPGAPLGDRADMAFATAIVTGGRGRGVVVATGMDTEVGRIAGLLEGDEELDTPLKRKLASFGKLLTIVGVAAALAVVAIGLAYGRPFVPLLLLAVSLAISVIPESLPATATIVMALGVQRMAKHQALVRRLPAVETLGGATVICTDKTGTLTENRMSVVRVVLGPDLDRDAAAEPVAVLEAHPALFGDLAFVAALCNDASFAADPDENVRPVDECGWPIEVADPGEDGAAGTGAKEGAGGSVRGQARSRSGSAEPRADAVIGDPTEGALLVLARDIGVEPTALRAAYPRLAERPFDSDRKRMATVHERDGQIVALVKGALDGLLPRCAFVMDDDGPRPMTEEDRARALDVARKLSDEALRVLAFATRALPAVPGDEEDIERELVLVGLVGMMDPPRPDVRAAVDTCRTAGVRTVMITGDHAATARAIGAELDIYRPGDLVVTGGELEDMDDAQLDEAVRRASVFARVSPYHKLRIVRALKHDGEVTAMTGDGVNDAPALKAADIGVAMGITGTDVAKDAADMVLLDDRFTTIVYAVREGRRVHRNIQKVVQFLVADNLAEIVVLLAAVALNWNAPLSAVMILWVNLATATLPALALGVEPASRHIMEHPPLRAGALLEGPLARRVVFQGLFVACFALFAFVVGREAGGDALGRTMAFGVLAFSQVLRALNQRSTTDPVWDREGGRNPWLGWAAAASTALVLVVLLVPPVREAFGGAAMNAWQWAAVLGLAFLSLVQTELAKAVGRWRARR